MEQDNNHDGGKDRRSVLRVVVENPRKWRTRQFQPADKFPFILPPVDLDARHEFQYRAMGMKSAQVNLAWRIAHKDRDRYEAYFKASERVWLLWQLLTIAIDQERRETLAILLAHYPAAARRIMKGCQQKPRGKV